MQTTASLNASFQVKALPEKTVVQHSDKVTTRLDYIIALFLAKRPAIESGGATVRLEPVLGNVFSYGAIFSTNVTIAEAKASNATIMFAITSRLIF